MPGVQIGESTIRHYVRERKIELRLVSQEVFIPQSYSWGQEAQVDWYEAYADIGEERQKNDVETTVGAPVDALIVYPDTLLNPVPKFAT